MQGKLKSFLSSEQTFTAGLLCLVGVVAFVLGRYSVSAPPLLPVAAEVESRAGVLFIEAPDPVVEPNAIQVVASKGGTKYHLPTCSGANRINEENKIYFDSIDQAKAAGYTPAANCPGLD